MVVLTAIIIAFMMASSSATYITNFLEPRISSKTLPLVVILMVVVVAGAERVQVTITFHLFTNAVMVQFGSLEE